MSLSKSPVTPMRIAFEEWVVRTHGLSVQRTRKGYVDNTVRVAWRAWQEASRGNQ